MTSHFWPCQLVYLCADLICPQNDRGGLVRCLNIYTFNLVVCVSGVLLPNLLQADHRGRSLTHCRALSFKVLFLCLMPCLKFFCIEELTCFVTWMKFRFPIVLQIIFAMFFQQKPKHTGPEVSENVLLKHSQKIAGIC